ncbi:MAG: hypothetical protein K6G80_08990, partial [Treponema sp.]|nr:hypothetical protein [Treponema sp.]
MTVTKKELQRGITSYTVSNGTVSFTAMNYGCSIMQILVPNKLGMLTDIVQGYDTLEGWKADTDSHNCIVGRFANRIAGAKFELDGTTYTLDANDGENCLHGGFTRWEKMVWDSESFTEDDCAGVRFSRISPDGEQGFPGNLTVTVTYALNTKNELSLTYTATTDAATPVNLTNHAYFNLTGGGSILDHVVQLEGSDWFGEDDAPVRINGLPLEAKTTAPLEVYGGLIPTGKRDENHVFDFRSPRPLSDGISGSEIPAFIGGYDHCFVTPAKDESSVVHTGAVWSP